MTQAQTSGVALPSYVHGASDTPLIGETIGVHFDKAAARWPDTEALVVRHQGVRWTYAEMKRRVDDIAAGFLALGLEPGIASAFGRPTTPSGR